MVAAALFLTGTLARGVTHRPPVGRVTARISFRGEADAGPVHDLRLTIKRSRRVIYSPTVSSRYACRRMWMGRRTNSLRYGCYLALPRGTGWVRVVRLDGSSHPSVVLRLYSGGASCCDVEQVYWWDSDRQGYVKSERDFGYSPVVLRPIGRDRRYEFVSSDGAFLCAFVACAGSGFPLKVLAFRAGRFIDVTTSFPNLIARNATMWLERFKQSWASHEGIGSISAWAADEELLGHAKLVRSYLSRQRRAGHLANPGGYPSGRRFISLLMPFLRQQGYLTGR